MSMRRMSRGRRPEFLPAIDGLETRVVPATAPTNVLAIPAQVAQLNAQVQSISSYVVSVVPYVLSVGGHLSAQGTQAVTSVYTTAQNDFAQLVADRDAVEQAADDQISTLKEGKFVLDSTIAQNYNTQVGAIYTYYVGLTPTQQAAQYTATVAAVNTINVATQSAYKTSHDYYIGRENAVIGLYNQQVGQINYALTNAANAVRLSGNLYNYATATTLVPLQPPAFTPLVLIKPVS